jgi:hypothetical protein
MKRGAGWEAQLDFWHHQYLEAGTARIKRHHPGVLGVNGKLRFTGVGPPDYDGDIGSDGKPRPVVFDAKESKEHSLYVTRLPLHQAQDLEGFWARGWYAFIAFRSGAGDFVLPWRNLREDYWSTEKPKKFNLDCAIPMKPSGWLEVL